MGEVNEKESWRGGKGCNSEKEERKNSGKKRKGIRKSGE